MNKIKGIGWIFIGLILIIALLLPIFMGVWNGRGVLCNGWGWHPWGMMSWGWFTMPLMMIFFLVLVIVLIWGGFMIIQQLLRSSSPSQMSQCPSCQKPIQSDWSHCPYCGVALKQ